MMQKIVWRACVSSGILAAALLAGGGLSVKDFSVELGNSSLHLLHSNPSDLQVLNPFLERKFTSKNRLKKYIISS